MESLYLLIPLSLVLVLALLALFGWALHGGQFDDLEDEGHRILDAEAPALDVDQVADAGGPEQSALARQSACADEFVPAGDCSWQQPPTRSQRRLRPGLWPPLPEPMPEPSQEPSRRR